MDTERDTSSSEGSSFVPLKVRHWDATAPSLYQRLHPDSAWSWFYSAILSCNFGGFLAADTVGARLFLFLCPRDVARLVAGNREVHRITIAYVGSDGSEDSAYGGQ